MLTQISASKSEPEGMISEQAPRAQKLQKPLSAKFMQSALKASHLLVGHGLEARAVGPPRASVIRYVALCAAASASDYHQTSTVLRFNDQ